MTKGGRLRLLGGRDVDCDTRLARVYPTFQEGAFACVERLRRVTSQAVIARLHLIVGALLHDDSQD